METYPSKLLARAIDQLATLPGIGKRSALRFALHLLRQSEDEVLDLSDAIQKLRTEVVFCDECFNVSDYNRCEICANPNRTEEIICIVEDIRDVMAIENTAQFKGKYHVLGGIISPMDGIGPSDLRIEELLHRVKSGKVAEIIMALSTTMEGDTTNFYIYKRLKEFDIRITTLAQGVASGDELEYADELTLGRSLINRIPYENSIAR